MVISFSFLRYASLNQYAIGKQYENINLKNTFKICTVFGKKFSNAYKCNGKFSFLSKLRKDVQCSSTDISSSTIT